MSQTPTTVPLRLMAIAQALVQGLSHESPELRRLLAPLLAGRIQTFGADAEPISDAVPFVFVDAEGRAGTHIARGPVSLHVRRRMNMEVVLLPFLVADLRAEDPGPWFGLFLLRELEALRLMRVRMQMQPEPAREVRESSLLSFQGFEHPMDVAQKHRLAAALLERSVGTQFTRFLQDMRRAVPDDRLKTSMLLAGDFCGEMASVWKGTDPLCQAYVAAALFHEVAV